MSEDAPDTMDMSEHEKTYERFLMMTKWGLIATAVVVIALAVFLL